VTGTPALRDLMKNVMGLPPADLNRPLLCFGPLALQCRL